jgi:hypothetical protein
MDRRQFLDSLFRAGLLSVLGITGAFLVWRRCKAHACADVERCNTCRVYADCPVRAPRREAKL